MLAIGGYLNINGKAQFVNQDQIKAKLTALSQITKKTHWIKKDLTVTKSNLFQKIWWAIIKHFDCLRRCFYQINHKESSSVLKGMRRLIAEATDGDQKIELSRLYNKAAKVYNDIVKKQSVLLIDIRLAKPVDLVPPIAPIIHDVLVPVLPPINEKPLPPLRTKKIEAIEEAKKELENGTSADSLLLDAVQKGEPELAEWLYRGGASLDVLKSIATPSPVEKAICDWLGMVASLPEIRPDNIDKFAIDRGYGYKTANLMILESLADKLNKKEALPAGTHLTQFSGVKDCEIRVPPFLGIGDFEIQHALASGVPDLIPLWNKFQNSFAPAEKAKFLAALTDEAASANPPAISTEGQKIIDEIQVKITQYFIDNPYFTKQMENWLEKEKPDFIIVRSTGKEDSDTNSNAGGNDSIPFVKGHAQLISDAMGKVIASYFGSKSVGQRLLAGDRTLFTDTKPFVPVLLQVMIGEGIGGVGSKDEDIPRSGVLFTRQSDKADGVTLIQAALGNNEGVVTGEVDVDSYYVDSHMNVQSVVRKKTSRFVSVYAGENKYQAKQILNNNPKLENSHALPGSVLCDLKRVADEVSLKYASKPGCPKAMDMEYTVKLHDKDATKPVIYLLQARPLRDTQGAKPIAKTYIELDALEKMTADQKISAETLLDGNAYVREINDLSEVLFVDDLMDGLAQFTKKPTYKAIISKKTAAATSHPAVTLRPQGVAVLVLSDTAKYAKAKQMMIAASPGKPALIDTQRGFIVNPVDNAKAMIKTGLVSYPIPLEATIPLKGVSAAFSQNPEGSAVQQNAVLARWNLLCKECVDTIQQLSGGQPLPPVKSQKNPNGYTLRGLLDQLAVRDKDNAKPILAAILQQLYTSMLKSINTKEKNIAINNLTLIQVFESILKISKKEVLYALENHAPQTLNRLYPIKFLDAMIFQNPTDNVVGGFSFAKTLGLNHLLTKVNQTAKTQGVTFTGPHAFAQGQVYALHEMAFNDATRKKWQDFASKLISASQTNPALLLDVHNMINKMNEVKMAPYWLNIVFNSLPVGNKPDATVAELKKIQAKDQGQLDWIENNLKILGTLEKGASAWALPGNTKKNLKSQLLDKAFLQDFGFDKNLSPQSLAKRFESSGQLGRIALLRFMENAITVYDTIIKSVSGSTDYPQDKKQKVKDFAAVLKPYFNMMQAVSKMLSQAEWKGLLQPDCGRLFKYDEYIKCLAQPYTYEFSHHNKQHINAPGFETLAAEILSKDGNHSAQLEARPEFNVGNVIIGSRADLESSAHWPVTLEEYFTTFHQNMDAVIKYFGAQTGMSTDLLPPNVKKFCDLISAKMNTSGKAANNIKLAHMIMDGPIVEAAYRVPLRQHAALFTVRFNPNKLEQGTDFFVSMFGNDEHDRWDQNAALGVSLKYGLPKISFTDDVGPKMNYEQKIRWGSSYSLHMDKDFTDEDALVQSVASFAKAMSMSHSVHPHNYPEKMQGLLPALNWNTVDKSFFSECFYMSNELMNRAAKANNFNRAAIIAQQSLFGLAKKGLKDYERGSIPVMPAGGFIKNLPAVTTEKSLLKGSLIHLLLGFEKEPLKVIPLIEELVNNKELATVMPQVVTYLNNELLVKKDPVAGFDKCVQLGHYYEAFSLALQYNTPELLKKLDECLNLVAATANVDFFSTIYLKAVLQSNSKLSSKMQACLQKWHAAKWPEVSQKANLEMRKQMHTNLGSYVNTLQNLAQNFGKNFEEIFKHIIWSFVGLVQNKTFDVNFTKFPGLNGYLGDAKYQYIPNNKYTETQKFHKSGALYLIKGFESADAKVRQAAEQAYTGLVHEYLFYFKTALQGPSLLKFLYAIAKGYYESSSDKHEAGRFLKKLWPQENIDAIEKTFSLVL